MFPLLLVNLHELHKYWDSIEGLMAYLCAGVGVTIVSAAGLLSEGFLSAVSGFLLTLNFMVPFSLDELAEKIEEPEWFEGYTLTVNGGCLGRAGRRIFKLLGSE